MPHPLHLVGIAGSLRQASFSRSILAAMAGHLPAGTRYDAIDIAAFPHYDQDLEETLPAVVAEGRARIAACDGVMIVTPEFNHGIPGVLKNTLDWLSRPAFKSGFLTKPVMFITHSPGPLGGVRAQYQLREALASMLADVVPLQELALAQIGDKIREGLLSDETALRRVHRQVDSFLAHLAG
ncbi:MAG: NADPH-dependent FMN reductase [Rhizomicrobium sp.]